MLLPALLFSVFSCFLTFGTDVPNTAFLQRNSYTGVSMGNFECHKNHKLSLSAPEFHAGQAEKVDSCLDCGVACTRLEHCFSYNFGIMPDANGKHICELLSTDKYNNSGNLRADADFHHFSIRSPCSENPCNGRGYCIPLYYKGDFKCACLADFKGKRCETYVLAVYIKANGCDDPGIIDCRFGKSSIQLNGVEQSLQGRGHNTVVVNMDGTVYSRKKFDTFGDASATSRMNSFVNSIPTGKVVLVATQDSADTYSASPLKSVGAVNTSLPFRGSWYLIGYKGDSKPWIQEGRKASGKGPAATTVDLHLTL